MMFLYNPGRYYSIARITHQWRPTTKNLVPSAYSTNKPGKSPGSEIGSLGNGSDVKQVFYPHLFVDKGPLFLGVTRGVFGGAAPAGRPGARDATAHCARGLVARLLAGAGHAVHRGLLRSLLAQLARDGSLQPLQCVHLQRSGDLKARLHMRFLMRFRCDFGAILRTKPAPAYTARVFSRVTLRRNTVKLAGIGKKDVFHIRAG